MTLKEAMRELEHGESWTIGTENGRGWLYYFDGQELHNGTHYMLDELLDRECIDTYNRRGRKHWSENDRKYCPYMELEPGLAFIIVGSENGDI